MKSEKAYNLLWISPTWKDVAHQQRTFQPIRDSIMVNIQDIARQNPLADVRLWVDSVRMNTRQRGWLADTLEASTGNNLSIRDLRDIPHYRTEPLYQDEDKSNWRNDCMKVSPIWRQVDAAKVLIGLQGDYVQSFYSDLDVSDLVIESEEVQRKLSEKGLLLRGLKHEGKINWENQLFGFNERGREFFERLYKKTLEYGYKGLNGYHALLDQSSTSIMEGDREKIAFIPSFNIACNAVHPGTKGYDPALFKEI